MTRTTSVKQDLRQGATIFFYQLKKSRTPLILFAVLAVFFGTTVFALTAMNARSVNRFYQVDRVNAIQSFSTYATLAVFFLTCVFTIIYTLRVFSYLHSKRKADWINPLPVKSGVLFIAKALAAFAAAVVPALVFIGVICIITACSGETVNSEILRLFLGIPLGSIACIAFYGLLAVCCGSSVNTVLSFLAISFCYPFSAAFVKGMIKAFFYAAPFEQTSHSFIMDALNPMAAYDGVNAVYWLLFTLGCFVLSVLLLRRRKAERAQTSFAYRLPCYAVEVLVTFIAGMMTGVIFSSTGVLDGSLGSFTFGFILGGGTAFIQFFLGAEAIVGRALFHQFLGIGQIHILAVRLHIGAVIAAHIGAFIPIHAAALEGIVDHFGGAFHKALLVGILNAQDEFSAHLLGVQVIVKRGAHAAQVHKARGGGRKSGTDLVGHMSCLLYLLSVIIVGKCRGFRPKAALTERYAARAMKARIYNPNHVPACPRAQP